MLGSNLDTSGLIRSCRKLGELIAVHLAGGVIWSMVNIGQMSFILDSATEDRMTSYSAVFSMVTGLTGFAGSLIGGYIMTLLPTYWIIDPTRFVLLLSAGLRVASGLAYLGLKEPHTQTADHIVLHYSKEDSIFLMAIGSSHIPSMMIAAPAFSNFSTISWPVLTAIPITPAFFADIISIQ